MSLIAQAANIPPIDLGKIKVESEVLDDRAGGPVAKQYQVFPVDRIGSILTIAVANPFDVLKLDDIRIITGCELRPVLTTAEALEKVIPISYRSDADTVGDLLESFEGADLELKEANEDDETMDLSEISDEEGPVVKMVNKIIADACASGSAISTSSRSRGKSSFATAVTVAWTKPSSCPSGCRTT